MAHVIHFHSRADETADKAQGTCESSPTILRKAKRRTAYVIVAAILLLLALVEIARAGGPQYVAGVTYFDPGLAGQPITWPNGTISYYTDLGSLSSILSGTSADAFVADAFSRWTGVSTAAVTTTPGGQLAENVSGANVAMDADRTMIMPADIQP